jgi:hypothetical protein
MKYLLVFPDDQIPKCVTVGCQDIMTNMDDISRPVGDCMRSRAKRWRSLLSLREKLSSSALGHSNDTLEKLKSGPRVLVDEIIISDDGT